MDNRQKYNKCIGWLISEWLEDDNINYTEQLYTKAEEHVNFITKYTDNYSQPDEELGWYEVEKIIDIYFGEDSNGKQ